MRKTRIRIAALAVTCVLFVGAWVAVAALGTRSTQAKESPPAVTSTSTSAASDDDDDFALPVQTAPPVSTSQS
jgi:flagellar basal body-associated protein FliL